MRGLVTPKETPLTKQYQDIKSKYPDTLLFFRLGDFYELFDDDAVEASRLMEITLTKRQGRLMCGIPYHAAATYLKKILSKSKSVAICEQVEDPAMAKGIVKREVVRVITPGTIIDDALLTTDANNFLAAVHKNAGAYGVVFLDVSTGDFMGCEVEGISPLESEVSRLPVREVVVDSQDEELKNFIKVKFPDITLSFVDSWYFSERKSAGSIKDYFNISTLKGWELDKNPAVTSACGGLIQYLKETQKSHNVLLKNFRLYSRSENMILDRNTITNLELVRNQQDGSKKNSLFGIVDFTQTSMGRRRLLQYILRPLKNSDGIRNRLNGVEELKENPDVSSKISHLLREIGDMERLIARTSFGNCNARDLSGLKESLKIIPKLKEALKEMKSGILKEIADNLTPMNDVVNELEKAIVESPPITIKDGGIIKKGYNPQLDELIEIASGDRRWIDQLEERERKRLSIPSLKVGYNKVHGYYIEVTKIHTHKVPDDYTRKQTLINAERYITEELKKREDAILGANEKKVLLEYKIFNDLRKFVSLSAGEIQNNAELISQLDVLNSFSTAAQKLNYIKPNVGDYDEIVIKDGRHPVVEAAMGVGEFIPNDTLLDRNSKQILIITGPNMAGKSTYLKQVAIITIMAQIGSFVPAREARIGLVDRIFTRIGAAENIAGGESTFMVEMTEVAAILNNATPQSLLIMDEVGRGTSTFDGISIAWAVVEEISGINSRTLFATHYFELTELGSGLDSVKNYNFAVREWKDKKKIVFLRKLKEGRADKSYGIHCAELAGVKGSVIKRSWDIFKKLEKDEFNTFKKSGTDQQLTFFDAGKESDIYKEKIKEMNLNNCAPLDIVREISKWQKEIENESD